MYDAWQEGEGRGYSTSDMLLAFAGGAILGAGAALLLGPKVWGGPESLGFAERGRLWASEAEDDDDDEEEEDGVQGEFEGPDAPEEGD
jgi:hypothetical protein